MSQLCAKLLNQYWTVEVGWNGGTMKTKVVEHVPMKLLPPISVGPVDISNFHLATFFTGL